MNLAIAPATLALIGDTNLFNGATLTLYTGTIPSTPETTATGTTLATWVFSSPAFSGVPSNSGGYDTLTASFVSNSASPSNSGTAGYARATFPTPSAWTTSHSYTRGTIVSSSSKFYVCTVSGTSGASSGPSASSYGILDNTCAWDYLGASSISTSLADFTVGTSGFDITLGTTTVTVGTQITISSFTLQCSAT